MKINLIPVLAILILVLALVFVIGAGCEQEEPTGQVVKEPEMVQSTVTIENFAFNPQELRVSAGTTVTWKNEGTHLHRIINNQGEDLLMGDLFDLVLKPGERGSYTFNKAGEYPYHCHLHPNMKGRIIVS